MYRLGGGHQGDPLFLQRRARVQDQYCQLRLSHQALPADLRNFSTLLINHALFRIFILYERVTKLLHTLGVQRRIIHGYEIMHYSK